LTDPAIVEEAVKLVANGIRAHGFKGRPPRLSRQLASGTLQTVYLGRQTAFRPASFSIGLTVVPAALMDGWREVAPEVLHLYETAKGPTEGLGYAIALDHAEGRLEGRDHAPSTPAEAERVAHEVVEQFVRAGLTWLNLWSDPSSVVAQVGDIEADLSSIGFTRAFAASLLELLPPSNSELGALVDQTFFLLGFWNERDEQAKAMLTELPGQLPDRVRPGQGRVGLDDWLAERLRRASGLQADRSTWPDRRQRLVLRLEERRRESQRAMDEAFESLGFRSFTVPEGEDAAIRSRLSKAVGPEVTAVFDEWSRRNPKP
jgi:hypothetical protein